MKRKAKELEEPPASRGMKRKAEELEEPPASPDAESPVPQADMEARLSEFGAEKLKELQAKLSAIDAKLEATEKKHQTKLKEREDQLRAVTGELFALKMTLVVREKMVHLEMFVVMDIAAREFRLSREDLESRHIFTLADLRRETGYDGPGLLNYLNPRQIGVFQELKERGSTAPRP
eukprot:m.112492 g.112492  ORF g.112492 m.112492 type:complete len:177 (+) comp14371_c0_seq3:134-664(+)